MHRTRRLNAERIPGKGDNEMIAFLTNRKCSGCNRPLWQFLRKGYTALICAVCDSPVRR